MGVLGTIVRRGRGAHVPGGVLAAVAALALVIAGCASGASPAPTAVPTGGVASPAVSTVGPAGTAATAGPASPSAATGTTSTDWGIIRDAVPAGFPLPPGAEPSDLPEGPYSGAYTTSTPAAGAATAVEAGLRDAGWTGVTSSGPTEAGEVTIDAAGATAGCRARVSIRPLGGLTAVVVLYGAGCP